MTDRTLNLTLDEFEDLLLPALLTDGDWNIAYNDKLHLKENTFVRLGTVSVEFNRSYKGRLSDVEPRIAFPFVFRGTRSDDISTDLKKGYLHPGGNAEKTREDTSIIIEQLWESLHRLGLRELAFEQSDLRNLIESEFVILVMDTGAMRLGLGSCLVDLLMRQGITKSTWVIVPVQVLREVQRSMEQLKKEKQKVEVVRRRPQITLVPVEIYRLKRRRVPVEFLRVSSEFWHGEAVDDRIILESIKDLRRERGIDKNLFLITCDRYLAQLARLENISGISINVPHLTTEYYDSDGRTTASYRYDLVRRDFVACSFPCLVWDLAHVFSIIRIQNAGSGVSYLLNYYFGRSEKGVNDWENDRLEVIESGADHA